MTIASDNTETQITGLTTLAAINMSIEQNTGGAPNSKPQ